LNNNKQEISLLKQEKAHLTQQAQLLQQDVQSQRDLLMMQHEVTNSLAKSASAASGMLSHCPSYGPSSSDRTRTASSFPDFGPLSGPSSDDEDFTMTGVRPRRAVSEGYQSKTHPTIVPPIHGLPQGYCSEGMCNLPPLPHPVATPKAEPNSIQVMPDIHQAYESWLEHRNDGVDNCLKEGLLSGNAWNRVGDESWRQEELVQGIEHEQQAEEPETEEVKPQSGILPKLSVGSLVEAFQAGLVGNMPSGRRIPINENTPRILLREEKLAKKGTPRPGQIPTRALV